MDPEFPRRGEGDTNLQGRGANVLFGELFPENCKKMKAIGPRGGVPGVPLRSVTAVCGAETKTKGKEGVIIIPLES